MNLEKKFNISKQYLTNFLQFNKQSDTIEVISTGNLELDKATGINGIPRGRVTEIYGGEASGKTTVALLIAKEALKNNGKVLYLDFECAINLQYLKHLEIDLENFVVAQPKYGEIGFAIIEEALINQTFDLIVIDSVAAMISESEYLTKADEQNTLGTHARMMSKGLKKIQNPLVNSHTAIVFINQLREKIGVMFGNPETTTGGRALRYFSSLRLEIKKADLIKNGVEKIGIKSKVTVTKNKLANPYEIAYINIYFGEGYDQMQDMVDYAIENEIILKKGSWFFYDNNQLCQGRKALIQLLKENVTLWESIKDHVLNTIKINN